MSKKKSFGHENHEEAVRLYKRIGRKCDSGVRTAIETVHQLAEEHHQTRKAALTGRTILPLLRTHVDGPVVAWLTKLGEPAVSFSEMVEEHGSSWTGYFERIYARHEAMHGWNAALAVAQTADSLIDLASFCECHHGDNEKVVIVETSREKGKPAQTSVDEKWGKRPTRYGEKAGKPGIYTAIDFTHFEADARYCQLCAGLNEEAEELLRLRRWPKGELSEPGYNLLMSTNLRIKVKNWSSHYCIKHTPRKGEQSEYAKAHARRETYYSTRWFITNVRLAKPQLGSGYLHLVRAASFILVDECPDQSLPEMIPQLVRDWHFDRPRGRFLDASRKPLVDHMERIVACYRDAGHRLATFVDALASKPGEVLLDEARVCGAFPEQIEKLIDQGFIHDPLVALLLQGRTIIEF